MSKSKTYESGVADGLEAAAEMMGSMAKMASDTFHPDKAALAVELLEGLALQVRAVAGELREANQ